MGRPSFSSKFGNGTVAAKTCKAPWLPQEARGHIVIIDQKKCNYEIGSDTPRWVIMHDKSSLFVGVSTKAHALQIMNEAADALNGYTEIIPTIKDWEEFYSEMKE